MTHPFIGWHQIIGTAQVLVIQRMKGRQSS